MVIGYRMPIPPINELLKAVKNPQGVRLSADFLCFFPKKSFVVSKKRCIFAIAFSNAKETQFI